MNDCHNMPSGAEVLLGSWEVEVDGPLDAQAFRCVWLLCDICEPNQPLTWFSGEDTHYARSDSCLKVVRLRALKAEESL